MVYPVQSHHIGLTNPWMTGKIYAAVGCVDLKQSVASETVAGQYAKALGIECRSTLEFVAGKSHIGISAATVHH